MGILAVNENRLNDAELNYALQKLSLHIQKSPLAVIDWDKNFCVTSWNPSAERVLGYLEAEALGQHASFIIPEIYHQHVDAVWNELLKNDGGSRSTNENITKEGRIISCEWYNASIIDDAGNVLGVTSLVQDVSEQVNYLKSLEYQATHDSLTQLCNRDWLIQYINTSIQKRTDQSFYLFFVDLDRFKEINDTLGHDIGDAMLIVLSQRLEGLLDSENYKVARLGGDEFAVITSNSDIESVANQIMHVLEQPVELSGMKLMVGAGIGIAQYPDHGHDATSLMRCADIAMYHAKENNCRFIEFSTDIDNHSTDRLMLLNDFRVAIDNNDLVLHFQPKIDLKQRKYIGYEALVRWNHSGQGLIFPDEFVPFVELTDLIQPMTMRIIENSFIQCVEWQKQKQVNNISINLSARNLLDDHLPANIAVLLKKYEIDASNIEFEVTESALMIEPDKALKNLQCLHDLGVQISIDDFGTGYSSLSYLRKMPIHKLKIDRAFVSEMDSNDEDRIIVESTINLAHNLGLKVVAEGVENQTVLALLDSLGCDEAQGYHISRPFPVEDLKLKNVECFN